MRDLTAAEQIVLRTARKGAGPLQALYVMERVQGSPAQKIYRCRDCIVYKEACGDEIGELIECIQSDGRRPGSAILKNSEEANQENCRLERLSTRADGCNSCPRDKKSAQCDTGRSILPQEKLPWRVFSRIPWNYRRGSHEAERDNNRLSPGSQSRRL